MLSKTTAIFKFPLRLFRLVSKRETFKVKSAIKEFYRHVHPDILYQAPERVLKENQNSLKLLNNYINSMEDNAGSVSKRLKFYTPEKTTRKNKKYFYFEVNLKSFNRELKEEDTLRLRSQVADHLLKSLETTVNSKQKKRLRNKLVNHQGVIPEGFADVDTIDSHSHPKFFTKNRLSRQRYIQEQDEISRAYRRFSEQRYLDEIKRQVVDQITMIDPNVEFKERYASELVQNLDFIKNENLLISSLFDPRLFLIDESLDDSVIIKFTENLDLSPDKVKFARNIITIVDFFAENHPNIMILLSNSFKTEVPGFVAIKWDAPLSDIVGHLENNMEDALEKRYDYLDGTFEIDKRIIKIKEEFKLMDIGMGQFSNSLQNENLFLTKLNKLLAEFSNKNKKKTFFVLKELRFNLVFDKESLGAYKINLKWNFNSDMILLHLNSLLK